MNRSRRIKQLDDLYSRIPDVHCKGLCQEACGPIAMSALERERLLEYPRIDQGDISNCPMLTEEGKCSGYEARPTVCRLFGAVEGMPCPFGCKPEQVMNDIEGHLILQSAEDIGGEGVML